MKESKSSSEKISNLRQQAESLLGKNSDAIRSMLPEDIQRLIHEFNVHQIELEMQNEELHRARLEVEESRSRFSDLYDFAPLGYFTFDARGKIEEVNLTGADLLGVERRKLTGRGFSRFIAKNFHDTFYLHSRTVIETMMKQYCEVKLINKDGGEFYARLESVPVRNHEGNSIHLRTAIIDISKLKQTEDRLLKENIFSETAINSLPGIFYLLDEKGSILRRNKNHEKVTGYSDDELSKLNALDLVAEEDREKVAGKMREVLEKGNGSLEMSLLIKGGKRIPYFVTGLRMNMDNEKYIVGMGIDITERKQAENEIKELNKNLEKRVQEELEKNREKDFILMHRSRLADMGEMIEHIAHQWKQPLAALNFLFFNIKDTLSDLELNNEVTETLIPTGEKLIGDMSKTIDNFRNFFKSDRQKIKFSINKIIKDSLSIVIEDIKYHNISVCVSGEEEIAIVGFPNEFSQVVLNIIGNARDAIIEKGIEGEIRFEIFREKNCAVVTIKDNGRGIPEKIINHIFDPYFTTKEENKGTGIGLYMSKLIIENHMDGWIEVKNIDDGAEFKIVTPIKPNESPSK